MREIINLAGFNGVASGCTGTLAMPTDRLYDTLFLDVSFAGSRTQADIEKYVKLITLSSAGQTIRQATPGQLNYINRINGSERFGFQGNLAMHFAKPWMATNQAEDMDALGTLGMKDLTLDVDLAEDAPAPKISAWAAVEWTNRAPGPIVKQLRGTITPAQSGDVDITTLRIGPSYSRIHFFSPKVTKVEVTALGRVVWTGDKARAKQLCALYGIK